MARELVLNNPQVIVSPKLVVSQDLIWKIRFVTPMNPNVYARDDLFRPTYGLCNYCKRPGHLRKDCKVIEGDVSNGFCYLDEQNYLCLGPYSSEACAIRMQPNMSQQESVMAAQPLRTPRDPDLNANTAENGKPATGTSAVTFFSMAHFIGKDTTPIATDDKDYLDTETFRIGNIAAASTVTPETQTILKRNAEKEAQFGRPKNVRFGNWNPARNAGEDAEMTDQLDVAALPPNKKAKPTKKSAADTQRQHSDKPLKKKPVPASEPVSGMEHTFLNILRDGKVSLSLKELINLSPPFVKYLR